MSIVGNPGISGALNRYAGRGVNTIYSSGEGENIIDGGAGATTVSYEEAPNAVVADFSTGPGTVKGRGVDTLTGIRTVIGSPFDDTFIPGPADQSFDGGAGTNTLSYEDPAPAEGAVRPTLPDPATVDLAAGTAAAPGRGKDTLANISRVIGSPYDDLLFGDTADNVVVRRKRPGSSRKSRKTSALICERTAFSPIPSRRSVLTRCTRQGRSR